MAVFAGLLLFLLPKGIADATPTCCLPFRFLIQERSSPQSLLAETLPPAQGLGLVAFPECLLQILLRRCKNLDRQQRQLPLLLVALLAPERLELPGLAPILLHEHQYQQGKAAAVSLPMPLPNCQSTGPQLRATALIAAAVAVAPTSAVVAAATAAAAAAATIAAVAAALAGGAVVAAD